MGFVYFFKHKEANGVKIGMTLQDDVLQRFRAFKTYSPRGAEILGKIETSNANILEKKLHERFADRRLNGEFFDIHSDEINEICDEFANSELINFYIFVITIQVFSKQQRILALEKPNLLSSIYNYYCHGFNVLSSIFVESSEDKETTFKKFMDKHYNNVLPILDGFWYEVKKNKNDNN